jgi:hypothetical protein
MLLGDHTFFAYRSTDETKVRFVPQGLHPEPGAAAFSRYVAFLFLSILAAESQALIIILLLPIFVAALAISAL